MNILTYNGQNIEQRIDGYVNATQMAQVNNKEISHWLATDDFNRYIEAISLKLGKPRASLLIRVSEGFPAKNAYWLHPDLAIKLGRWISVDFEIWCDQHIKTLMETGKTELVEQPKLTNRQISLELANTVRHITDTLDDNPRLAQLLIDNALMDIKSNVLTASKEPELKGVAQIAVEMGYKVDHSNRVRLGQFVAKQGFKGIKEKRLCNGQMLPINCYLDNKDLRDAIAIFFNN